MCLSQISICENSPIVLLLTAVGSFGVVKVSNKIDWNISVFNFQLFSILLRIHPWWALGSIRTGLTKRGPHSTVFL